MKPNTGLCNEYVGKLCLVKDLIHHYQTYTQFDLQQNEIGIVTKRSKLDSELLQCIVKGNVVLLYPEQIKIIS